MNLKIILRMKFLLFLIICCQPILAQHKVSEEQLSKISIVHTYHCDFKAKKYEQDFDLGELQMTIRNLQFQKKIMKLN